MKQKIKIGTTAFQYAQIRNFAGLPFNNYKFIKKYDFFKILNYINYKLYYKANPRFAFSFFYPGFNNCKLFHFFNTISYNKTPWITTFEEALPRWGNVSHKTQKKGIKLLAGNSCKKLIALSQFAYDFEYNYLKGFPEYKDIIIPKMCVIHPAQELLIKNYQEKKLNNNKIIFTLIGNQFFGKGGRECISVLKKLILSKRDIM